jgi:hypothetical protein
MAGVALRPIEDAVFDEMRGPESVRMAAFTAENPDDRAAFDAHMAKIGRTPGVTRRAIALDGRLVGTVASFVIEGDTEVTASLKVLQEAGFTVTGTDTGFANARKAEIQETILRLDDPPKT